ncbi:hypothetical protein [Dongia sedimenti]|uniref:MORN repeat protein n=1 Tax=Dongia sedimenti TaxID=3064282 RepID=A0ABU0YJX7_9PROT|nr:hypothetical protein [Rhodospirillaceae bacterium R-7]
MRWPSVALAGIAMAVVGIAGWQAWEAEQLKVAKWMDTERPNCQVWDPYPQRNETATWSGDCRSGKAEGEGTLAWHYTDPAGNPLTYTNSGGVLAGKLEGQGTAVLPNGNRYEGMYRDGQKDGHGVFTWSDSRYDGAWKDDLPDGLGTYTEADGEQHTGEWKQGCLDDHGDTFALLNDMDACEEILKK